MILIHFNSCTLHMKTNGNRKMGAGMINSSSIHVSLVFLNTHAKQKLVKMSLSKSGKEESQLKRIYSYTVLSSTFGGKYLSP